MYTYYTHLEMPLIMCTTWDKERVVSFGELPKEEWLGYELNKWYHENDDSPEGKYGVATKEELKKDKKVIFLGEFDTLDNPIEVLYG